jgi:hypothetical protein
VCYEIRNIISNHYKVQTCSCLALSAFLTCGRPNKYTPGSFLNANKLARRVSSTTTTTEHRIPALFPIPYYNSSWLHECAPPLVRPLQRTLTTRTHSHFRVTSRRGSRSQSMRMARHHASGPLPPSLPIQQLHASQPRQPPRLCRVQPARPLARSEMHQKRFTALFCIICGFSDPATGPQSSNLKTQERWENRRSCLCWSQATALKLAGCLDCPSSARPCPPGRRCGSDDETPSGEYNGCHPVSTNHSHNGRIAYLTRHRKSQLTKDASQLRPTCRGSSSSSSRDHRAIRRTQIHRRVHPIPPVVLGQW